MRDWLSGLRASLPIAVGYLPVAVTFGFAGRSADLSVFETVFASATVFAGASQFALVGLAGEGSSLLVALAAALALNVRHLLYGPVLAPLLRGCARGWLAVLAFGLTDEVFGTAAARLATVPEGSRHRWLLGLVSGAYGAWVSGTWLGAAGGSLLMALLPRLGPVLAFALPVLFLVLLLPLLRGSAAVSAAGTAVVVTLPLHLAGRTGVGLLVGSIMGVLAGMAWDRWMTQKHSRSER